MQILNIQTRLEAFECKFIPFEMDSKHSNANLNLLKGIRSIWIQIQTTRRDSKHSNANSNLSKGIRSVLMQILPIQKSFEAFE